MHRRYEESIVTEDDINELKSDISTMRYEMLEIFEKNGMDISSADKKEKAHMAKRMKSWERRLMKDFHVAPVMAEDTTVENVGNEKGIARFRRVAQQVVQQTNSHKWNAAVKGATDSQIGRCRNRESFQNQQNLQKAMIEAKRLIFIHLMKQLHNIKRNSYFFFNSYRLVSRSPVIQSRPCTPVEFYDPTTNTLLELLKNITEEVAELSPHGTVRTKSSSDRDLSPAILSQKIHDIFASKMPSPLPLKFPPNEHQKQSNSTNISHSIEDISRKSPSPTTSLPKNKNSNRKKPISLTHSRSQSRDETHGGINSPPPLIQITRTDSNKTTTSKSKESLMERRKPSLTEPLKLG